LSYEPVTALYLNATLISSLPIYMIA
jgi:hypothetical protein